MSNLGNKDIDNFDNKKLSNNKRTYKNIFQDFEMPNPNPKRKKSDSDIFIQHNGGNSDNSDNDNSNNIDPPTLDLLAEINNLKTIINKQKKQINTLEKKTKDVFKKGTMLEDAVNDLYDMIEDWNEDYNDDTNYEPKLFTNIPLKNNVNTDDTDTDDSNSTSSDTIFSSENNNSHHHQHLEAKPNNKSKSKKKKSKTKNKTKNKTHIPTEALELELSNTDLKRLYSNDGETYLQELIKEAIKKSKPEEYIEKYCLDNNLDSTKSKNLLEQYKRFDKLNKLINNSTEQKISEIDVFIKNTPQKRDLILQSMEKLQAKMKNIDGYKFRILSSGMDTFVQQQALYKVKQLENTEVGTGEYYKIKNWLDTLTTIPFNNFKDINLSDNSISKFLENSRKKMDTVIYGQNDTKDIIIQIIAKMISNPGKCGNVFAIYGPPGVGKTTIIKEGMSKALGIPFAFLSLGGASDSSYLEGHGYTYEGSTPGKIVDILRKVECMNPIFYFDELDKISETRKGEEIANLLIHLTDPSQNSHFQDKYLGDINLDLSKSIFVFSFNNIEKVNPILLDRMELIYVDGFTNEEKLIISKQYLIPELLDTYKLYSTKKGRPSKTKNNKIADVSFTDDNLDYIIKFNTINSINSPKEDGVRSIKRRLEKICSNLNIIKLTKGKWNNNIHSVLDKCDELKNCSFPITLSNDTIKKILLNSTSNLNDNIPFGMYM